jgi:Protein of unknown function (DUF3102)
MSKRKKTASAPGRGRKQKSKTKGNAKHLLQSPPPDKLATRIRALFKATKTLAKRTVENTVEIGRLLSEAKDRAGHGNWLPWLEREFGWKERSARNFIQVYEASQSANFADLSLPVSAIYLLTAPSTPESVRKEIIERAEAGEKLSFAEVKETINEAKAEDEPEPEPEVEDEAAQRAEIGRREHRARMVEPPKPLPLTTDMSVSAVDVALRDRDRRVRCIATRLLDLALYSPADESEIVGVCEYLRSQGEPDESGETAASLKARRGAALAIRVKDLLDAQAIAAERVVEDEREKSKPGKGPKRTLKWVGQEYALTGDGEGYVNWEGESGGFLVGHGKLDAGSAKEHRLIGEAATIDEAKALAERDFAGKSGTQSGHGSPRIGASATQSTT